MMFRYVVFARVEESAFVDAPLAARVRLGQIEEASRKVRMK